MKIVHFSDPHAGGAAEDWHAYFDKRWVGVFNYRFRRRDKHDLGRLKSAVEYILDTRPDVAVCTGDLTSTGQPGEFGRVLDILKPLRDSSVPLLYMPGNHDCYVKNPRCVAAVNAAVDYLSRGEYRFSDMPLVREYAGVEFALVNCCRPSNLFCSWGFLAKADSAYVERWCASPKTKPRILLSHYPMTEDHPLLRIRHRLFGQGKIVGLMRSHAIDLVLCGHIHKPYLKVDADGRGECCAGSVTSNRGFFEIEVTPAGKFSFRRVD
ncbi:MAG: metallophosphoesterase, partial [Lentisphaeria bacterium]|nr:metallophosphoesterase [Lentisphaeria bacterium]